MEKLKLHERFRLFIQCISFCFHNGYVRGWLHGNISSGDNKGICVPGLNCYSCPGAVGACPLGSLQAVLDSGKYHMSLYVFGFIAGLGVFCGRFVCGWLCPFGLIQDLLHRIPLFKKVKNMPGHKYLRYLRFVLLALFVIILPATVLNAAGSGEPWFCEWICPSGTLLGGIPLLILNPALRPAAGIRFLWKCFILLAVIVLSMKYYRPFCKYVCPLGAMYGVCNPISIYRLKCDESACVKCGACQRACGMDIKVWETPNSIDCIRCGKCLKSCPTGALTTTFTKKKTEEDKTKINSAEVTETSEKTENTSASKPSVLYIIWGYILIVLGVVATIASLIMPIFYVINASIPGDLSTVMFVYIQILAWIVPAVMLIIFGSKLSDLTEKPEYFDKLKKWPLKLLLVWGITFAVVYCSNIFTFMLDGGVELRDFWNNIDYIFSNAKLGFSITLAATLLTVIFIRNGKKDTGTEDDKLLNHPLAELSIWAVAAIIISVVIGSIISSLIISIFGLDETIIQCTVSIVIGILFLLYFIRCYRKNFRGDALFKNCKEKNILIIILIYFAIELAWRIMEIINLGGVSAPTFTTILAAFQPGFTEEVISRMLPIAVAMYIYKDRDSVVAPLVLSSVFFGLMHLVNLLSGASFGLTILQVIFAFAAGIFFGALYIRTGSIVPGVIIHFLHDLIGMMETGVGVATGDVTSLDIAEIIVFAIVYIVLSYLLLKGKSDSIKSVWNKIWVDEESNIDSF